MEVGFIGFGEASFEMSSGLKEKMKNRVFAYDPMWDNATYGPLINKRAETAGVILKKSMKDLVERVTILFVAVPANQALEVSEEVKKYVKDELLYIDVSASTPEIKKKISNNIEKQGGYFIDVAMMGSLPVYKHQVPILASGTYTDLFIELMSPFQMNITKVSDIPGDASAVKLIRSIFMKGLPALLIEMLEVAHQYKVDELVINSISETMDKNSFQETMNRLVTGTSVHAFRRALELEGTIEMIESSGLDPRMSIAARDKIRKLNNFNLKEKFEGRTLINWIDVIETIKMNKLDGIIK